MSETEKKSNTIGFKSRGSTASWKLRATQPDGTASELFLVDGMTIGRTNANSIQACDDGSGVVERSHARVDFQDDGSVVLKCLHESAGVETSGSTVSSLRLEIGSSFRIGQTQFEVIANPTSEQVSIASAGRGCPYCGHPDLPADRGVATRCAACGKSVVVVPAEQNLGVPTFLPGVFHDAEGKEYPIERFVARGGMGYVLKGIAEQDTAVAIKVLIFDSNTNTQAVSRFKQEIDLLRKLHDPNVLRLISHGQEAGLFFFVMEWVDGHDLRSELPSPGKPETHVDFAKALRWFEQACEGLSAIHRAGAVHRDIKPSNLLLRNDGQLLIADLGVAKRLNEGETGMTCTGQLPGTYWYMAPEQHYAPDLVDQRTDIYSLGLTFWELLTGFRPNGVDPQPPSKANPSVPAEFDEILRTMLASRIDDRPSTMLEVLRSLPKPVIRPASQVRNEPALGPSTTVTSPTSTATSVPQELQRSTPTERTGTGSATSGPPPDHIGRGVAKVEAALRKCDALIRAGIAYLRPRIINLIALVAKQAADLRQVVKSAMAPRPPVSPLPPSGNQSPAAETTGASAARTALGDASAVAAIPNRSSASDSPAAPATATGSDVAANGQAWEGWRGTFSERVSTPPSIDEAASEQAAAREAEAARAREEIEAKLQEAIALPEGSNERLDALKAARRALTLVPAAVRTATFDSDLRPAIEEHLRATLRTRGDEAFSAKRYGLALFHYQELRQLSLADELISDRIDQILALRKSALASATTTLRRGHLGQAREQLVQLQTDFIGDAGFIPECEQLLAKTKLIEQRVKETIPALRATKSLFRMSKLLEELAADKIAISGLDELLEKTRKTLSEGTRRLETARTLLDEGKVESARKAVAEVRSVISDHPDADELSGRADAEEARQNQLVQQIHALTTHGQLLRVYQALRSEDPKRIAKLGLVDQFKNAAAFKRRSDRFLRLVLWAVGGSACMYVASHLSHRLWGSFTSAFTNWDTRHFLSDSASGRCLNFTLFAVVAYLGLYGLRELLGRNHKTRSVIPDIVVLLVTVAGVCAIDIGLNILIEQISEKGTSAALDVVNKGGYWLRIVGTAALYASAVATFTRLGVDIVVPKAVVPLKPAILFGLAFAIAGAFAPLGLLENSSYGDFDSRGRILGIVPSSMLAMATLGLLCSVRHPGVYGWPVAAAVVGFFLAQWANIRDFSVLSWGVMLWQLTLACGVFLAMQSRTRGNAILAAGIAFAAVGTTSYFLSRDGSQEVFTRLLPWAAACVIVPAIAQPNIVRGMNFPERFRDFLTWLRSPASGSTAADIEHDGADEEQDMRHRPKPPSQDASASPPALPQISPQRRATEESKQSTPRPGIPIYPHSPSSIAPELSGQRSPTQSPSPRSAVAGGAAMQAVSGSVDLTAPRRPPMIQAGILLFLFTMLVQAVLGLSGLPDAARISVYMGGAFAGICMVLFGCLDKWAIRPQLSAHRIPGFGIYAAALVVAVLGLPAILAAMAAAERAAQNTTTASQGGAVVPINGTPFQATVPTGWHQMAAPNPTALFTAGDASESVALSFSAVPAIDLPAELHDPRRSLDAWLDSVRGQAEDFDASSFTPALLQGQQALQGTLDATFSDPTAGGTKARLRFVRRTALVQGYLCEVTVYGLPSQVNALGDSGIDQLMQSVRVATP
jgi:serine/threonine protein kinase